MGEAEKVGGRGRIRTRDSGSNLIHPAVSKRKRQTPKVQHQSAEVR